MLIAGLTSITFRHLQPTDIVRLAADAGIGAIEWGSDIHVPIGDLKTAEHIRRMCEDAGITVCSYGTYCRLEKTDEFEQIFKTADELGADTLRIWAGALSNQSAGDSYKNRIVSNAKVMAEQASELGLKPAFEYHRNTLTDSAQSAVWLIKQINMENVSTYWQPRIGASISDNIRDIGVLKSYLSNVHVFHWSSDAQTRYFLEDGRKNWEQYLNCLDDTRHTRYCLIEFVKDDKPESFVRDAATLNQMIRNLKVIQTDRRSV